MKRLPEHLRHRTFFYDSARVHNDYAVSKPGEQSRIVSNQDQRRPKLAMGFAEHVQDFAIDLVMATQPGTKQAHDLANKFIRYGSSPRGAQALVECGRVFALMKGRLHLSTEDIETVAPAVLRHRIILNFDAHAEGQTAETILSKVIPSVGAAVH